MIKDQLLASRFFFLLNLPAYFFLLAMFLHGMKNDTRRVQKTEKNKMVKEACKRKKRRHITNSLSFLFKRNRNR